MKAVSLILYSQNPPGVAWSGTPLLAQSPAERITGLSNATRIAFGQGMLFNTRPGEFFTLEPMKIPLDMVWIGRGSVIRVDRSPRGLIAAPAGADMLLEIGAGHAENVSAGCSLHILSR